MSIYAIGDLQGCFFSLQSLLKTIDFNSRDDELWFVGDLVNRGKGSLEVLNWCYNHRDKIKIVLGNHDLHFLAVALKVKSISKKDTIAPILESKNLSKFIEWLLSIPLVYGNKEYLMVHAGISPFWSSNLAKNISKEITTKLNKNPKNFLESMYGNFPNMWDINNKKKDILRYAINSLTRMRTLNKDGSINFSFKESLNEIPTNLIPWYLFPAVKRKEFILSGHWSAIGIQSYANGITLDSGCIWGRQLSAYNLEKDKVISVNADPRDLF
jgi:bis(5'-nucleosyl)-tetraphosphatase (symmetrical)|tara:strand:- start:1463 stop:2272 length:810 start_codon:yes stop_codon:yes gene_type:complete